MASTNTSLNESLKRHISDTNVGIQRILSARTIPLWINPNNTNYYISNPYKAGDIVILLSNTTEIYYILQEQFESIASNIGVSVDYFNEKNNPEVKDEIIDVLINGGYLTDDQYINPMTIVSQSEKGYGLYVSLKNQNYDTPGNSDSWFNLDMSESLDSVQLQISRIISILTSSDYISQMKDAYVDPNTEVVYIGKDLSYLENRLNAHKKQYHFGERMTMQDTDSIDDAYSKLNQIQAEIESQTNTTTSIMRNPFILNNEIIGDMLTVVQTTGQMFYYCILDTTKLEKDKDITINFTPNNVSNILIPLILKTSKGGLITVTDPATDEYIKTKDGQNAWFVESYVNISNDIKKSNNITIETTNGFEDANFNNNFTGFMDTAYIATYTPIGAEVRTENIAIHCSPIKEISRTNKSLTFQLASDYVWKYTGIAISLSGKCEVNA